MAEKKKTGFLFEEIYLWHDAAISAFPVEPGQHFENPETKRRFRDLLAVSGLLERLQPIRAIPAAEDDLARFHTRDYIAQIKRMSAERGGEAGEFTPFGPGSYEIALLAAGGVMRAVEAVATGAVENAYALVRPPGHHAEPNRGRGYCIFGNIALAVMQARAKLGIERIAVVDWDVHHGNGTQQAFYENPNVLTMSIHQDNLYPANSGSMDDNGIGKGAGYNINIPMPPGCGGGAYVAAFEQVIVPALKKFKPELIVVASGLDAAGTDPLGRMMLQSEHYRRLTRMILEVAAEVCAGRVVLSHEGGYSAVYVPFCGLAIMEELSGIRTGIVDPFLELAQSWGYQELQPHQAAVIDRAAALLIRIK
ncbi:MAG: class II histone deacetylase [Candidatus Binatus sp.]|uniref:class II histone deacetylase n=1 Tax=Candidatus Binatus sp. TaxID=2811406 RepID=UPI00272866A0|nr:class II histone deacetylase [Candidatus Binatus sp.]MDO8431756.1 class II histone deacetylase [Candidatus Binatus sp.]